MSCHSSIIQYIKLSEPPDYPTPQNDTHSKVFLCISHIQTFHIIWARCGPMLLGYMTICCVSLFYYHSTARQTGSTGCQISCFLSLYTPHYLCCSVLPPYNLSLGWTLIPHPSPPCVYQQSDSWFQVHQPASGTGPWDDWHMNCSGHWGGAQWEWLQ